MCQQDNSFSRQFRLLNSTQYKKVFHCATPHGGIFSKALTCRNEEGRPRLGIIVSRKAVPKAVRRNHLKRLVRESFRNHRGRIADIDIVLLLNKKSRYVKNEAFFRDLELVWEKIG